MNDSHVGELDPAIVYRAGAGAAFLIICDHAGRAVPSDLDRLGLAADAFERHIAWDIGAAALSVRLGEALGACTILQRYSRLVIDCNRAPESTAAIPPVADGANVPGNRGLDAHARSERVARVHAPYHAAIARELDAREARGSSTIVVLVHSFTPRLDVEGRDRPWHFGVLHEGGSAFSLAVLRRLQADGRWVVGENEPYCMDATDYTAPRHALARGLDYLELEVRQDLLADDALAVEIARTLADLLPRAASDFSFG